MQPIGFSMSVFATPTGVRRHDYRDAPLTIEFGGCMSQEITIFCPDAVAADLAEAIRGVLAKHGSQVAVEAAPYVPGPSEIPF